MTDVNNVNKMQIGLVILMCKFVICSYVNFGTLWVSGGVDGDCTCQDIAL